MQCDRPSGAPVVLAGREKDDLFDESCYDIIHRYAGGVPRLVNTLCDTALLCAFADGKDGVGAHDIRAAITELGWQEHASNTGIFGAVRNIAISHTAESHVTQIEVVTDGETVSVQSFPPGRSCSGGTICLRSLHKSCHCPGHWNASMRVPDE